MEISSGAGRGRWNVRILEENLAVAERAITDCQKDLRLARKQVREAEAAVDRSKFSATHKDAQKDARIARKRAKDGEAAVDKAKATVQEISDKLTSVRRDQQPDEERIIGRLESELAKSHGFIDKLGGAAVHDLCALHAAGSVDEVPVRRAASMLTSSNARPALARSALVALVGLEASLKASVSAEALHALCEHVITTPRELGRSAEMPYVAISKYFATVDGQQTSPALVEQFITLLLEKAEAMAMAEEAPAPHESGVLAAMRALAAGSQPKEDPLLARTRKCPMLGLLLPVLKQLRASPFETSRLEASLRQRLQGAIAKPIAAAPDYSMPEAAEKIGSRFAELSAFLASSTERELPLNCGSKGRMHIHHLIQDVLGSPNPFVSHESEGYGSGRVLVVRKKNVRTPEELELLRQLQAKHVAALDSL